MPIYDYTCSACGHLTEVVHAIHDHGPRFCPECGADGTMKKSFAPPTIHFKGSGWAKKDRGGSGLMAGAKGARKETGSGSTAEGSSSEGSSSTSGSSDSSGSSPD